MTWYFWKPRNGLLVLLCWVALCLSTPAYAALDPSEVAALEELRARVPGLATLPQLYLTNPQGITMTHWPANLSTLCENGDGLVASNLECRGGHIRSLACYDPTPTGLDGARFRQIRSPPLTKLAGLTYLEAINATTLANACWNLIELALGAQLPLTFVRTPSSFSTGNLDSHVDLALKAIENSSTITELEILYTHRLVNLTEVSSLGSLVFQSLGVTAVNATVLSSLLPPQPISLTVLTTSRFRTLADIAALTSVTSLTLQDTPDAIIPNPFPPTSSALTSLTFVNMTRTSFDMPGAPALEQLIFRATGASTIASLPPTLKVFRCESCLPLKSLTAVPPLLEQLYLRATLPELPASLGSLSNLVSFELSGVTNPPPPKYLEFPLFISTRLERFALTGIYTAQNDLAFVCDLPSAALKTLILQSIPNAVSVPNCTSTFPQLTEMALVSFNAVFGANATGLLLAVPPTIRTLSLRSSIYRSHDFDWATMISDRMPVLESLDMTLMSLTIRNSSIQFPTVQLSPALKSLTLSSNGLGGTIPDDFFTQHPLLERFVITNNLVTGTLPSTGLENMVRLDVSTNRLTGWGPIVGAASNLTSVNLDSNRLTQIPPDSDFTAMPALQYFSASNNPNLVMPVPNFFGNHPAIRDFRMNGVKLSGSLPPEIISPNLRSLHLQGPGSITGNFPEIRSLTSWSYFYLNNHRLDGVLPPSFTRLAMSHGYIDISNNDLQGSLPSPIFSIETAYYRFDVSNNPRLGGPIPDFRRSWMHFHYFSLRNTSIDVCAQKPNMHPTWVMDTCEMPTRKAVCACKANWPTKCTQSCPLAISGPVTIVGDFTFPPDGELVFGGLYTVTVTGCVGLELPSMTVDVDEATAEQIGKAKGGYNFTALAYGSLCKPVAGAPEIVVAQKNNSCKRSVGKPVVSGTSLTVVFTVDSSRCKSIWWIILVSVAGGVILIVVVVLVFYKCVVRRKRRGNTVTMR